MENKEFIDYPFTSDGVNFISRIYSHSKMAAQIAQLPLAVIQQMNDEIVQTCIGDASLFSTAELLTELDRVNDKGTEAFILLGAN